MRTFNSLDAVVLQDSYVLSIDETPPIKMLCELALSGDHPLFTPPPPDLAMCYWLADIIFTDSTAIEWQRRIDSRTEDPDGTVDFGNIHSIAGNNGFIDVHGDFGHFIVKGHRVDVAFIQEAR